MRARPAILVTAVILILGCSDGGTVLPDPEAEYTPPDAAFSMSLTDGVAPLTITFTDSSAGEITEWIWDFGDGSTSTDQNPQHTFVLPQLFEVRLVVHDGLSYGIATTLVNVHLDRSLVNGSTGYGISAAVARIDANASWDAVAANTGTNSIAWWPTEVTGEFGATVTIDDSFAAVADLLTVDLEGDGDQDIIAASPTAGVAAYLNAGDGSFGTRIVIDSSVIGISSIAAADFDGDTFADVVATVPETDQVVLWLYSGGGVFSAQTPVTSAIDGPAFIAAADLNGINTQDLVVAARDGNRLEWLVNDGAGNFSIQTPIQSSFPGPEALHLADLDNDGDVDVISGDSDGILAWWANDGMGFFGTQHIIDSSSLGVRCISVFDLDYDGTAEIIAAHGNQVSFYRQFTNPGGDEIWITSNVDADVAGAASALGMELEIGQCGIIGGGESDTSITFWSE